ncbi:MAG: hypothetical protein RR267_05245 [Erysipelotrichaceae bacterium]
MKKIFSLFLLIVFILILIQGKLSFDASFLALTLWYEKLVPSLFTTMVLVRLLYEYHVLSFLVQPFNRLLISSFHMNAEAFSYVLASIVLGFPTSSLLIDEADCLTIPQKRRLIYSCSFASPAFIILTCGNQIYHQPSLGFQLFIISLCSGLFLLLQTRKTSIELTKPIELNKSFALTLSNAICSSIKSLFMIGGYLMLITSIQAILLPYLPPLLSSFLNITTEFSSGSTYIAHLPYSLPNRYCLQSGLLAFGGFCVHLQIFSLNEHSHLIYSTYLKYRIVQAMLAMLFAYYLFR